MDELARVLLDYLSGHPRHRSVVAAAAPLPRVFKVRLTSWHRWLRAPGVMAPRRASAISALNSLPAHGTYARVGRALLQQWATGVAAAATDHNLIRLWVATRIWGAPYRFGPIHTYYGLTDRRLLTSLRKSATSILSDPRCLRSAYESFHVSGTGEPFFTKWFWAVSLAQPNVLPQALISDSRVHRTLGLVDRSWRWCRTPESYCRYVDWLHDAASLVGQELNLPAIDAERIEWLLFDRPIRGRCTMCADEPCLYTWLTTQAGGVPS